MTNIKQLPPRQRKTKNTLDHALVLRALLVFNNTSQDLKRLIQINKNPDAVVEITRLLLIAYMVEKIIRALL